ncbi:hypothetical protein [Desertivirga xinjiangensis]|uniref:hypothetical protein n=1 Tax=Desertivirga xinjiangensis TaxID=539206 RepID=UPI002108B8BD|nr:hypothetical protein [Pedobacter xinjiangensis]
MKTRFAIGPDTSTHFTLFNKSFTVAYKHTDDTILHGYVSQISKDEYEVFIREKEVIIQCKRDSHGILSCKLNSKGNVAWVDGICGAVAKTLMEQ